jgi:hypothetical protein
LAAGSWEDAVNCAREHRTDDLAFGTMDASDIPGGTGYAPRWELFGELTEFIKDDGDYFRVLGKALVETEKYAPPIEVEHYFAPKGRDVSQRRLVMNPAEQQSYDALPTQFPVHRGCTRSTRDGCSWTRNRKIAEHFAEHPASVIDEFSTDDQTPIVISGVCKKSDVLAVFTRWGEEEVFVLPNAVTGQVETAM